MSVFSVTALDRLIESDRRSSSQSPAMGSDNSFREGRPLYVSYAYSSREQPTSPEARSPSPSAFSPSPYIVNHKKRAPGGLETKRISQENKNLFPEKSLTSTMSGSRDLFVNPRQESKLDERRSNSDTGREYGQDPSTASWLTEQVHSQSNKTIDTDSYQRKISNETHQNFKGFTEEKAKRKKPIAGTSGGLSLRKEDLRGKNISEDRAEERLGPRVLKLEWGTGSSSVNLSSSNITSSRYSNADEFFDAPDTPLDEYSSDDESYRHGGSSFVETGPSARGDPEPSVVSQLQFEIQRRIKAEEALEALQQQRDGMARMLYLAGISVPALESISFVAVEQDGEDCDSDLIAQKILVARVVATAIARGAVRAEVELELQTAMADKTRDIARLRDKLQNCELLNHEMSHRNQEAIEMARRRRRKHQRMQRLVFLWVGGALCLGISAAVCYNYMPRDQIKLWRKGCGALLGGEQSVVRNDVEQHSNQ